MPDFKLILSELNPEVLNQSFKMVLTTKLLCDKVRSEGRNASYLFEALLKYKATRCQKKITYMVFAVPTENIAGI